MTRPGSVCADREPVDHHVLRVRWIDEHGQLGAGGDRARAHDPIRLPDDVGGSAGDLHLEDELVLGIAVEHETALEVAADRRATTKSVIAQATIAATGAAVADAAVEHPASEGEPEDAEGEEPDRQRLDFAERHGDDAGEARDGEGEEQPADAEQHVAVRTPTIGHGLLPPLRQLLRRRTHARPPRLELSERRSERRRVLRSSRLGPRRDRAMPAVGAEVVPAVHRTEARAAVGAREQDGLHPAERITGEQGEARGVS